MMKRILSAILFGTLLLASLAACGETAPSSDPAAVTASDAAAAETTTAEETTARIKADIPDDADYEGYEFRVVIDDDNLDSRVYNNFDFETESGDALQDGIYRRNLNVEEMVNVVISQLPQTDVAATVSKAVLAGDSLCDLIVARQSWNYTLATAGALYNLYDVPYLDLDADWWDASLKESFTVAGKLFYDTGEITVKDDILVFVAIFNKAMWSDAGLDSPYGLVTDGLWTLDKMASLAEGVNADLNGDGVMDKNDKWGFASEYAGGNTLFFGSGEHMISKVGDQSEITFGSDRAVNVVDKLLSVLNSGEVLIGDTVKDDDIGTWPYVSLMFQENRIMMRTTTFEPVPRDLRKMDADFGVLPVPKYDEAQDGYHSMTSQNVAVASIPVTADAERSGIVTEALAVESMYTVTPAFYDLSLQGKVLRDDESSAMLDIIFANKVYDVGFHFNVGGFTNVLGDMVKAGSNTFVSKIDSLSEKALSAMDKVVETFEAIQ